MAEKFLHCIMSPGSIAIVGASANPMKMGTIQYLNLVGSGFQGDILLVHPTQDVIFGRKAYSSIKELPYAPELAILVVPTKLVSSMMEDFGRLGTRYAVVITAGFKEIGEKGERLEHEIVDIARRYGMRFLGPNCMGIVNSQLPLNATVLPLQGYNGKLGLASQSGTYVTQTLPYLHKHGICLSKAISVGNEANIDITDCLEYLGEDKDTKVIALYIESIRRAGRFLELAREISRKKPIVAQYVGGTEAGARAGSSHTGAMAGPDYIYDGLFEQAGIIRVNTIEELYTIGWALASQPPIKGNRIAILTNSGGPGTAIANTCNKHGLTVPEFPTDLQERIRAFIPGHAIPRNPVDLTFHTDAEAITQKIPEVLFSSDEIDGIIIHGIMDTGFSEVVYPMFKDILKCSKDEFCKMGMIDLSELVKMPWQYNKPLVVSSFFDHEDHCVRSFHENGIPTFDSPEKTASAMAALYKHYLIRTRACDTPENLPPVPENARQIIDRIETRAVDEYKAKQILRAYGIPTTNEALVHTYEDALKGAHAIGYPVALKACSPDILHKTEQGLVYLNIKDDEGLKNAYESIKQKERDIPLLVCEMLKGDRELMAGMSYFPGFPPCIMFGLGGIFTEALKDRVIRLAPLSHMDAISQMMSISSSPLLGPYRGMKSVDRDAFSSILINLGYLSLHFPQIKEIDLNPIMVVDGYPKVADALFIMEG